MSKYTGVALDAMFFEKPLYYEHKVISNLEELNAENAKNSKELNKNFQNISNVLDKSSEQIISSIQDEMTKARIQSAIENERLARGIAETNYKLLEVAIGIDGLSDIVRFGNENIVKAINQNSEQIIDGLSYLNGTLNQIDNRLEMVNNSLNLISNQLQTLIEKISRPNETQALELADQARINLSLNKKERALKVTKNALELSNGTSITVLAYHILTLSLFDDEESKKELVETYRDYVNLVSFKLSDYQSDEATILQEIENTLYPVMAVIGNNFLNSETLLLSQKLYGALYESRPKTDKILEKPLLSYTTLELINSPNRLRELHWSLLLNEYVTQKNSLNIYIAYINDLAKSKVLIKNELMILAVKNFYKEGFLYAVTIDALAGNSDKELHTALKVILSLLPVDIIEIDPKTCWALKVFAKEHNIKINEELQKKFEETKKIIAQEVEENYLNDFNNTQTKIKKFEEETKKKAENITQEHTKTLAKKMQEWEKYNKAIDDKGYDKKLSDAKKELEKLKDKVSNNNETFKELGGSCCIILGIGYAISWFIDGEIGDGLVVLFIVTPVLYWIAYFVGAIIDWIVKSIREARIETLKIEISNYKKELAKKYNITNLKNNLSKPYNQKIDNLQKELSEFIEKHLNELNLKFTHLINIYLPQKSELFTSSKNIKEIIDKKILDSFIANKRPNDLKSKYSAILNFSSHKTNIKKFEPIDLDKLATEYYIKYKIEKEKEPTPKEIIEWLESIAENGDAKAQFLIGSIYYIGDEDYGISADQQKALYWYTKAANNDIADAQCLVGEYYRQKNEFVEALKWYEKAKDLGHPSGKYNYGLIKYGLIKYAKIQSPEELEKAIFWIKEARDDGLQTAKEFIEKEGLE